MERIIPFDKLAKETRKELPDWVIQRINQQLVLAANRINIKTTQPSMTIAYSAKRKRCKHDDHLLPLKYRVSIVNGLLDAGYKYKGTNTWGSDIFALPLVVKTSIPEVKHGKHFDTK